MTTIEEEWSILNQRRKKTIDELQTESWSRLLPEETPGENRDKRVIHKIISYRRRTDPRSKESLLLLLLR
jgi:hypothetical protein